MSEAPTGAPTQPPLTTPYDDRAAARVPGVHRSLSVRSSWQVTTISVFELVFSRDSAGGSRRCIFLKNYPRSEWEARPDECLGRALTLIHPALEAVRAVGAED